MSLFADAFDAVVDSDLGVDATYKVGGIGTGTAVRVLLLERDMTADLLGRPARVDRQRMQIPAAAVATPRAGDTLTIAAKVWKVAEPPQTDPRGISHLLDCSPA